MDFDFSLLGDPNIIRPLTNFFYFIRKKKILLIGAGGDIIARGGEKRLISPLADAITLLATAQLSIPIAIGIFGLNCDGELSLTELKECLINKKIRVCYI